MEVNLFFALILDIFVVAIIKGKQNTTLRGVNWAFSQTLSIFAAIARRRRPSVNDDPFCIGPDVYSFPSGHASRSSLLLGFFMFLYPFPILFWPALCAWWFSICISRWVKKFSVEKFSDISPQVAAVPPPHSRRHRRRLHRLHRGLHHGYSLGGSRKGDVAREVDQRREILGEWRWDNLRKKKKNLMSPDLFK